MTILASQQLQHTEQDVRSCTLSPVGLTTAAYYRLITYHGILWRPAPFIWIKAIPNTCKIFLWLAFRGRLNTNDNRVQKCWASDPHCAVCPTIETADHIILRCRLASKVWKKLNIYEQATQSTDVLHFVDQVLTITPSHLKSGWPICFGACTHNLWKARNHRTFQQRDLTTANVTHQIRECLQLWENHIKPQCRPPICRWIDLLA
ncbi:uncharacterized protein [Oryza sativa Japonica Group]|uniref:uncharacterized protein n=1 Tax=Oryza sativa subsp. japonica TaxID=39947 RepID=UPI0007753FA1|nr:uncharacterized protein LOC107280462 [Oryza sativa Japonica Group]